jgi:hypothetical protein
MKNFLFGAVLAVGFAAGNLAADTPETPVGILLSAGDAKLMRANTAAAADAKTTDLLFAGDSIRTGSVAATYLFCAGKTRQTLGPKGEAHFESAQVRIKTGKITAQQPAGSCLLPPVLRVSVASQQSFGSLRTRGDLDQDTPPVPHDKLPAAVLAEIAPFEKAAATNGNDPSPLVGMAAVFEKANLPANAYEVYGKIQTKWPGVVWVKAKMAELDQILAAKAKAAKAQK